MTDLVTDLKEKFRRGDMVTQLIFINVGVFVITALIQLVLYLFNLDAKAVLLYASLPADLGALATRPWGAITYMFMHDGIFHILFNMLILYWFGGFFLNYFSAKHLRGLYLLGGLIGGIFFIAAYHIFPIFENNILGASLVGASASVLSIMIAIACKVPNHSVRLLFIGAIKLKYLALIIIILDLITITGNNPGGHIAHLGGAFAGYLFVLGLSKGWDLTSWINKVLDFPIHIKRKYQEAKKRKNMKVVKDKTYAKRSEDYQYNSEKKASTEEIDRILDKIKESGYTKLTEEEKRKLFNAGK